MGIIKYKCKLKMGLSGIENLSNLRTYTKSTGRVNRKGDLVINILVLSGKVARVHGHSRINWGVAEM